MAGKVFISCGQKTDDEKRIAKTISKILKEELGFTPWLAFRIQSLKDIMTITKELRSSDYFLFIDFLRYPKDNKDLPVSLFTHQELALAHHVGFQEMIALQQKGVPQQGFLRYLLSNPESFDNENDLLKKIRQLVKDRKWSPDYSRNLVVRELGFTDTIGYKDHTGVFLERVLQIRVENKRSDVAAIGTVCILDYIQTADGTRIESPDRSYLKWAGQAGYERTILPKDFGDIDLFSIHGNKPGLFLHSLKDTPREPILTDDGDYELFFKLFSPDFSLIEFSVKIKLKWTPKRVIEKWTFKSSASLVT